MEREQAYGVKLSEKKSQSDITELRGRSGRNVIERAYEDDEAERIS